MEPKVMNHVDVLMERYQILAPCKEDTDYVRSVMRKTLVAAVARIYEPGRKFDCRRNPELAPLRKAK